MYWKIPLLLIIVISVLILVHRLYLFTMKSNTVLTDWKSAIREGESDDGYFELLLEQHLHGYQVYLELLRGTATLIGLGFTFWGLASFLKNMTGVLAESEIDKMIQELKDTLPQLETAFHSSIGGVVVAGLITAGLMLLNYGEQLTAHDLTLQAPKAKAQVLKESGRTENMADAITQLGTSLDQWRKQSEELYGQSSREQMEQYAKALREASEASDKRQELLIAHFEVAQNQLVSHLTSSQSEILERLESSQGSLVNRLEAWSLGQQQQQMQYQALLDSLSRESAERQAALSTQFEMAQAKLIDYLRRSQDLLVETLTEFTSESSVAQADLLKSLQARDDDANKRAEDLMNTLTEWSDRMRKDWESLTQAAAELSTLLPAIQAASADLKHFSGTLVHEGNQWIKNTQSLSGNLHKEFVFFQQKIQDGSTRLEGAFHKGEATLHALGQLEPLMHKSTESLLSFAPLTERLGNLAAHLLDQQAALSERDTLTRQLTEDLRQAITGTELRDTLDVLNALSDKLTRTLQASSDSEIQVRRSLDIHRETINSWMTALKSGLQALPEQLKSSAEFVAEIQGHFEVNTNRLWEENRERQQKQEEDQKAWLNELRNHQTHHLGEVARAMEAFLPQVQASLKHIVSLQTEWFQKTESAQQIGNELTQAMQEQYAQHVAKMQKEVAASLPLAETVTQLRLMNDQFTKEMIRLVQSLQATATRLEQPREDIRLELGALHETLQRPTWAVPLTRQLDRIEAQTRRTEPREPPMSSPKRNWLDWLNRRR